MELLSIFTAFGLSFSAGLNAYIPLFIIGALAHYTNLVVLSKPYDILADPWALIILGVLIIIEFLADKVPAINHVNDGIQTFFRPVAGAIAFAATAGVITNIHPLIALACGLLVAGGVHAVKSAVVRPVVTATTGGVGNTPVSMLEDITATVVSFLSILIPILIVFIIILFVVLFFMWRQQRSGSRRTA
jgi:uncharacterized membrane protein